MTDKSQNTERDEALYAFHREYVRPTAEDICKWVAKYPEYAEDIRTHAAIALDCAFRPKSEFMEEPSKVELDRANSNALNILYDVNQKRAISDAANNASFQQLMAACNKDIPALAREIGRQHGIARSILADLVNGGMKPPIGERFCEAVEKALFITREKFNRALQLSLASPRMGYAKATVIPTVNLRSYEEIVRDSGMKSDQIQYWLGKD